MGIYRIGEMWSDQERIEKEIKSCIGKPCCLFYENSYRQLLDATGTLIKGRHPHYYQVIDGKRRQDIMTQNIVAVEGIE